MPLITIVVVLIVVGILLWLVNMIPMDPAIHTIIRVVIIIAVVIWLLGAFGLLGPLKSFRIGK
jgi:hypothetical protein